MSQPHEHRAEEQPDGTFACACGIKLSLDQSQPQDTGSKGSGIVHYTGGDKLAAALFNEDLALRVQAEEGAAQQPAPETKQELDPWPNPSPLPEDQPAPETGSGSPWPHHRTPEERDADKRHLEQLFGTPEVGHETVVEQTTLAGSHAGAMRFKQQPAPKTSAAAEKHTPGPWPLRKVGQMWHIKVGDREYVIGNEANARLISAAPETAAELETETRLHLRALAELERVKQSEQKTARECAKLIGEANLTVERVKQQLAEARETIKQARTQAVAEIRLQQAKRNKVEQSEARLLAALKLAKRYIEHENVSLVQVTDAYEAAIAACEKEAQ